jgi:FlaG/FlaF family flagellin (archaellin)
VIGVILMVAITVILAAVVTVFGFSFGSTETKGPTASIQVGNVPETTGIVDMKIVHKAGDRLKAGDWRLSIVRSGDAPAYITGTTDFSAGDAIITTNVTNSGVVNVTNRAVTIVSGGTPNSLLPETKYDVKIIVYPYKTMVVDAVVSLR